MTDRPRKAMERTAAGHPVVAPDRLELFIATTLVSPNVREHYQAKATRTKRQREAVCLAVWAALHDPRGPGLRWRITDPAAPKVLTFTAHTARRFDSHDNLRMACKPLVDGCIDAGLIRDDRDDAGHAFEYAQVQDGRRGVAIRVQLRNA